MKYYMVTIPTKDTEKTTARLIDMAIYSMQIEDPADLRDIIENQSQYNWDFVDPELVREELEQEPRVIVFFETKEEAENLAGEFENATVTEQDDEEWKNKYKEHFKSLKLTDDIAVIPSWEKRPGGDIKVIDLDPGMAFGTGAHETTSMCARLLEMYGCENKKILDVGTGSGILAIAAALMGCTNVLGVDIDDTAVEVAKENVEKNGLADVINIRKGDLAKGIDYTADMVVANIIAELVIELAGSVKDHLVPGGKFISSGILKEKCEMVETALKDLGFIIDDVMTEGDWCAIGAHYE